MGRQNTGHSSVGGRELATKMLRVAEGQTEQLETSMNGLFVRCFEVCATPFP